MWSPTRLASEPTKSNLDRICLLLRELYTFTTGNNYITVQSGVKASSLDVATTGENLSVWGLDTTSAYIDGTGTAGADNTAQTVKSITLPAGKLDKVGRKIRIKALLADDGGGSMTVTLQLNGVTLSTFASGASAHNFAIEVEVSYLSATTVNYVTRAYDQTTFAASSRSGIATAGFVHSGAQEIIVTQSATVGAHITVYELYYERTGGV